MQRNMGKRLDKIENALQVNEGEGAPQHAELIIYDPNVGVPERQPQWAQVVILIPDNGRGDQIQQFG